MALNIPMPGAPGQSFLRGIDTGGNLFSRMMQPVLSREKMNQLGQQFQQEQAQKQDQFMQELALRKQAEARMGANMGLNRQLLQQQIMEHELKTNPKKLFEFIQAIKSQGNQMQGMPSAQQPMTPFGGSGMPSSEEIDNPYLVNTPQKQSQSTGLFDNLTPEQQMALGFAGIKIPTVKENPNQKRYAELQNKIQLEKYKTQQKKALEQEKSDLKIASKRQEVIDSAKNDLPHLESTLDALEKMKKIATNNPDLFGHSGIMGFGAQGAAERFANTTDNPNAGAWQTYGLGPIVAAESKMSSKGNQLALKQALANKPNFAETQSVALAKIKASIKQIKKNIEDNRKLTGDVNSNPEIVIVIDPNGKKFKTTKENAAHLPEGWKNG
jgi:hypothetical protein